MYLLVISAIFFLTLFLQCLNLFYVFQESQLDVRLELFEIIKPTFRKNGSRFVFDLLRYHQYVIEYLYREVYMSDLKEKYEELKDQRIRIIDELKALREDDKVKSYIELQEQMRLYILDNLTCTKK